MGALFYLILSGLVIALFIGLSHITRNVDWSRNDFINLFKRRDDA